MECNGVHSNTGKVARSSIIPAGNREKDTASKAVAPPGIPPAWGTASRKADKAVGDLVKYLLWLAWWRPWRDSNPRHPD